MNDGGDCRTAPATPGLLKIMHSKATFADSLNSVIFREKKTVIFFLSILGLQMPPLARKPPFLTYLMIFNRPGVAGAVL